MKKQRLSKVLAAAGIASRRACEKLIFAERVRVNDEIVLLPQTLVDEEKDRIFVDGKPISSRQKKATYLLNKPKGCLCSNRKTKYGKSVFDLFEGVSERLFTAGRLDKATEGLLIVTNDGHFANQVIHPSSNIQKEYLAKADLDITHNHLKAISAGIFVEGVFVKPIHVSKVRKNTLKVTIAEGKKHEVRHLLKAAGLKTLELKRIRIGGIHLGKLPLGSWRPMTEREKKAVFQQKHR